MATRTEGRQAGVGAAPMATFDGTWEEAWEKLIDSASTPLGCGCWRAWNGGLIGRERSRVVRDLQRHAPISLHSRHVAAKKLTGDAPCLGPPLRLDSDSFLVARGELVNLVCPASSSVVLASHAPSTKGQKASLVAVGSPRSIAHVFRQHQSW
jgi:hypothetical protein